MRFSGALALSWGDHSDHPDSTTTACDAATTEHLQTYFEHHPELGVRDVLAIPQVYPVITGDPPHELRGSAFPAVPFLGERHWCKRQTATDANATSARSSMALHHLNKPSTLEDGKHNLFWSCWSNSTTATFFERVPVSPMWKTFEIS
ncbi:hypothetical protein SEMRO_4270_G353570.1 [Seminavis robusta]|uniref:Uncharacterized protein n=1 Tax=Seminavis robusta TaxID=568900 RepID=A0A9N8I1R7_9STRA|nr:hypothetical protein SEMRO_4270_G353570.1 [Seminavis robusta]|eukprot:Sro4270_g353570.1 n/a (148) ;mRNA; r:307-750